MNNYNFTSVSIKKRGGTTAEPTDRLLKANRFYSQKMEDKALYLLQVAKNEDGSPIAFMLTPTTVKGEGVVKTAKGGVLNCATLSELFFERQPEGVERLDFGFEQQGQSLIFKLKKEAEQPVE